MWRSNIHLGAWLAAVVADLKAEAAELAAFADSTASVDCGALPTVPTVSDLWVPVFLSEGAAPTPSFLVDMGVYT